MVDGGLAKSVSVFMPDAAGDLTVNEAEVDRVDGDVWLLPGDYVFDAFSGNPWMESSGGPVTVVAGEDYQYAEVPGATASDVFREEVQRQIDDYLAECMASTELEPVDCPNSAYGYGEVRNVTWTLTQAPDTGLRDLRRHLPADPQLWRLGAGRCHL